MSPSRDSVAFTKGLLNGPGQNNCFLNSAVQVSVLQEIVVLNIFSINVKSTMPHIEFYSISS